MDNFFKHSSKGYPRYCEAQTLADGTTILTGGRSRRGKLRGPPGSRDLQVKKNVLLFPKVYFLY